MADGAGKTAFVLAGGGSLGAIQVGMLQALAGAGLKPDVIVGSSVGALNAAGFAGDPTPQGAARLAQIWRGLRRHHAFPLTPPHAPGALAPPPAPAPGGPPPPPGDRHLPPPT